MRLHLHYPEEGPPVRLDDTAGRCIHGHFWHHAWNIGARAYYPHVDQFITVLREPLEMMISDHFYRLRMGSRTAANLEEHLTSVLEWPRIFTYANLPFDPWHDGAVEVMARDFVWVGVVERLARSIEALGALFGRSAPSIPVENAAPRSEVLADREHWASRFREHFVHEYRLYDFAAARS